MKRYIVAVLSLLIVVAAAPSANALGASACTFYKSCTPEELCLERNIERNWPIDTGYHEDCDGASSWWGGFAVFFRQYWSVIAAVGVVLAGGGLLLFRRRLGKRNKRM